MDETLNFFPHALNAMLASECKDRDNKTVKVGTQLLQVAIISEPTN